MLTTEQLLRLLEQSLLVPPKDLERLRKLLAASPDTFTPRVMMKWLVHRGALTSDQAERLLSAEPPHASDPPSAAEFSLDLAPIEGEAQDPDPSGPAIDLGDSTSAPAAPKSAPPAAPPPAPRRGASGPPQNAPVPAAPSAASQLDDLFAEVVGSQTPVLAAPRLSGRRWFRPRQGWDSPLMLLGGGGLLLLAIASVAMYWLLSQRTTGQLFDQAEQEYAAGAYHQAIPRFEQFLERYPDDARAGQVQVHLGLARLRLSVDETRDWPRALALAETTLPAIATRPEFGNSRGELAALLPTIAEGLARLLRDDPSTARIEEVRRALALVEKYVPADLLPRPRVADIEAALTLAERRLARDAAVAAAAGEMERLVGAGRIREARAARRGLLSEYPDVDEPSRPVPPELAKVDEQLAEAERAAVRFVSHDRAAETTEPASPVEHAVRFAPRRGEPATGVEGRTVAALVSGTLSGIDAATGELRWQRFLGFERHEPPLVVAPEGRNLAVLDSRGPALVCLDAATGQLRWRQPLDDDPGGEPRQLGEWIVVPTRSGKLLLIRATDGFWAGHYEFAQPLLVPPVAATQGRVWYQLAAEDHLLVLNPTARTCVDVVRLGHDTTSVRLPPLVIGQHVIVVENDGARRGRLRVLETDDDGLVRTESQHLAYAGHCLAPPAVVGRTLYVATDEPALRVFLAGTAPEDEPLRQVAERTTGAAEAVPPHVVPVGAGLWFAGDSLERYEFQSALGRLSPSGLQLDPAWRGSVCPQPPQAVGPHLFVVHGDASRDAWSAAMLNGTNGALLWETRIAAPTAVDVTAAGNSTVVTVLSATGQLWDVPLSELKGAITRDAPTLTLPSVGPFQLRAVGSGRFVARGPLPPGVTNSGEAAARPLVVVGPPGTEPRSIAWDPKWGAATTLGPLADGWLAPAPTGTVRLVKLPGGEPLGMPFQPAIEPGVTYDWQPPVPLGPGEALLADGRSRLFRVAQVAEPEPRLEVRAEGQLPGIPGGPAAVSGPLVWLATVDGTLLALRTETLEAVGSLELGEPPAWGPTSAAGLVLVAGHDHRLRAFRDTPTPVWELPLDEADVPVGSPLVRDTALLLCTRRGHVLRLDAATGRVLGRLDVGWPLRGGPFDRNDGLLVVGDGGALYAVPQVPEAAP